jgi:hypothetical protein
MTTLPTPAAHASPAPVPAPAAATVPPTRRSPSSTRARRIPAARAAEPSERAQQVAVVVLNVLGGNQGPGDAARTLGISMAHYYLIEQRAIRGLLGACEPRLKRGPQPDHTQQVRRLEQQNQHLTQALLRQQAIVRSTHRGLGIRNPTPPIPKVGKSGTQRRARRPTVRALRQANRIAPKPSPNAPSPDTLAGDQRGG